METPKTMLSPEELSARISVAIGTLQDWRVRRKAGETIGPPFVKFGAGRKATVRYRLADVEQWEADLGGC